MLKGKKIVVGVCGSIAAYKTALLVRLLIKEGALVKVVMTESSKAFITPLTLSTLSKNEVYSDFFDAESGVWANHVELGMWADFMLIAPVSANSIGKFANGLCDNLLSAVYLSAKCPVFLAPAMDLDMYQHGTVTDNLKKLATLGNFVIDAESGELASGLVGQGRMAEPEHIVAYLNNHFSKDLPLKGKTVLLTAGPTQEAIDPVRFISNHSSGKMGYALAEALADQGASVTLVSGPTQMKTSHTSIHVIHVSSANEMYAACQPLFPKIDIALFAAAVADYRPKNIATTKIKKKEDTFTIEMTKNVDIAHEFGKVKTSTQRSIGFALETNDEFSNAQTKLEKKNFDMVILNSMQDKNATFGHDTNKITIIKKGGKHIEFELKSKTEVAKDIVNEIIKI